MSVLKTLISRCSAVLLAAAVALPLLSACADSKPPVAPSAPVSVTPPVVVVPPSVPAPARAGRIYAATPDLNELYTKYHGTSLGSRYVLYDDSTFALQFESGRFGPFEYPGRFTRVDTRITFTWEGWSLAGPWGSEATLRGDSLIVRYNLIMQMTDFVDGTYVRVP